MKQTANVLLFITVLAIIVLTSYFGAGWLTRHRSTYGTMHPVLTVIAALAIAFTFVNYFNPFKRVKPFNCITCLTGWIALILAYCFNVPFYLVYFPIGILTGALFERLTMKFL